MTQTNQPKSEIMTEQQNEKESMGRSTWRVWILLTVIAPILLLSVSSVAVFLIVAKAGGDSSVIPRELGAWFPYIAMINHTLLLLITVQFARSEGISFGQLGWRQTKRTWMLDAAIGVGAGIVIFLLQTHVAEPMVTTIRNGLQVSSMRPESTPVLSFNVAGLIAGTLFAGIVEETVYRGYIQPQLTASLGTIVGVLVTTAGFAIGLHWGLGPWSLIVVFFDGLLLALLFEWRKNLLACALAHAVVNAMVVMI